MVECLNFFATTYALAMNPKKSKIFVSPNTSRFIAWKISAISWVPLSDKLGMHFGVPIIHGQVNKETYLYIIEHLEQRLDGWKYKLLSLVNITVLILWWNPKLLTLVQYLGTMIPFRLQLASYCSWGILNLYV